LPATCKQLLEQGLEHALKLTCLLWHSLPHS
jgi:hypothetical protein